MGIYDKQRMQFKVRSWDQSAGTGTVIDKQGITYLVAVKDLDETAMGQLYVGEVISGFAESATRVSDLMPDQALSHERKEFSSVGPAPDINGWAPQTGNHDIGFVGSEQKPHDGRFSHPDRYVVPDEV